MCRKYLSSSGTSGSVVCMVIVRHAIGNDEDSGENPCSIPKVDRMEQGAEKHRQDVGDTGVQGGLEGVYDEYNSHIPQLQVGGSGDVGVSNAYL